MAPTSSILALKLPVASPSFTPKLSYNGLKLMPSFSASKVVWSRKKQQPQQGAVAASSSSGRFVVAMSAVTLPVLDFEGQKAGEVELDLRTARPETAKSVVHRGVITEMQNRRRGTASTLTRAEVRGGGRKPYKQKGSGKARQGSIRTPLRPGGGVIFGPKPKDWSIKINKKEKRLAISTALQSAAVNTIVVEDLDEKFTTPKTKEFIATLKRWGIQPNQHTLLFATNVSEPLLLSSRNIGTFKLLTPRSLNLYDVLRADKIILTKSAVEYLDATYGASTEFEFVIGGDPEETAEQEGQID
jgi:large subunit ribosomal protein L4